MKNNSIEIDDNKVKITDAIIYAIGEDDDIVPFTYPYTNDLFEIIMCAQYRRYISGKTYTTILYDFFIIKTVAIILRISISTETLKQITLSKYIISYIILKPSESKNVPDII